MLSTLSQKETFVIMNLLDGCLRVSNSAVVLATCKAFLNLTEELPEIQTQVRRSPSLPQQQQLAGSSIGLTRSERACTRCTCA